MGRLLCNILTPVWIPVAHVQCLKRLKVVHFVFNVAEVHRHVLDLRCTVCVFQFFQLWHYTLFTLLTFGIIEKICCLFGRVHVRIFFFGFKYSRLSIYFLFRGFELFALFVFRKCVVFRFRTANFTSLWKQFDSGWEFDGFHCARLHIGCRELCFAWHVIVHGEWYILIASRWFFDVSKLLLYI